MPHISRRLLYAVAFLAVCGLLPFTVFLPARRESQYVCEATGSTKLRTTWFLCLRQETCTASPLERFIESKSPSAVQHRWVWQDAAEYNLFGARMLSEDTFHSTAHLATFVGSGFFADLPSKKKEEFYSLLTQSAQWSEDRKTAMYRELVNSSGEADVDRILSRWRAMLESPEGDKGGANPR
jgi:hypothetical protein